MAAQGVDELPTAPVPARVAVPRASAAAADVSGRVGGNVAPGVTCTVGRRWGGRPKGLVLRGCSTPKGRSPGGSRGDSVEAGRLGRDHAHRRGGVLFVCRVRCAVSQSRDSSATVARAPGSSKR